MRVTEFTRDALAHRRERRDLEAAGWERMAEGGAPLWELYRGPRQRCRIAEARVGADGKTVWIRVVSSMSSGNGQSTRATIAPGAGFHGTGRIGKQCTTVRMQGCLCVTVGSAHAAFPIMSNGTPELLLVSAARSCLSR